MTDPAGDQVSLPNKESVGDRVSLPNKDSAGDKVSLPNLADLGVHLTSDLRSDTFLRQVERVKPCDFKIGHFFTLAKHMGKTSIPWKRLPQSLSKVFAQDWSLMVPETLRATFSSWYFY